MRVIRELDKNGYDGHLPRSIQNDINGPKIFIWVYETEMKLKTV